MDALGPMTMGTTPLDAMTSGLLHQAKATDPHAAASVASGFESLFLSQLMKEMRQTLEPGGLFGQDEGDVYGGMFDLYMSQHLAQAGGFGLAAVLKQQLTTEKGHVAHHT